MSRRDIQGIRGVVPPILNFTSLPLCCGENSPITHWTGGWANHLSRCVICMHWSIVSFWQRSFSPFVVLKMLISVSYVTFRCEWFVTVHTWCWRTRNKRTLVTMKCIFLFEVVMTLGIYMTNLSFLWRLLSRGESG